MTTRSDVGISNREAPVEEARDRLKHPPDVEREAAESAEDEPQVADVQTSTKTGTKALAQKDQSARYREHTAPSATKVGGAFGKE